MHRARHPWSSRKENSQQGLSRPLERPRYSPTTVRKLRVSDKSSPDQNPATSRRPLATPASVNVAAALRIQRETQPNTSQSPPRVHSKATLHQTQPQKKISPGAGLNGLSVPQGSHISEARSQRAAEKTPSPAVPQNRFAHKGRAARMDSRRNMPLQTAQPNTNPPVVAAMRTQICRQMSARQQQTWPPLRSTRLR